MAFPFEQPHAAGLESVRTELQLNHDSAFVRNFRSDIAGLGRIVINHERKRLSLAALEKTPPAQAVRNIGGANEEIRVGVTVRCSCCSPATGPCGRRRRAGAYVCKGRAALRVRQASRRYVSMLPRQDQGKVRLFEWGSELQVSLKKRSA